jgi:hypothetical protein
MRANQRNQIVRIDRLGGEELEQRVGRVRVAGQEACRTSFGVVFAADEGADAGAEGAYDGGDVGAELDDVGHGHAVLIILGVPFVGLVGDGREAVVVGTGHFVAEEDAWDRVSGIFIGRWFVGDCLLPSAPPYPAVLDQTPASWKPRRTACLANFVQRPEVPLNFAVISYDSHFQ